MLGKNAGQNQNKKFNPKFPILPNKIYAKSPKMSAELTAKQTVKQTTKFMYILIALALVLFAHFFFFFFRVGGLGEGNNFCFYQLNRSKKN